MKVVIMAAGMGKRLRPITDKTPKPLVSVLGKPILGHIIEALPRQVSEIIIVVSPANAEKIKGYLAGQDFLQKIDYVIQEVPAGTADALWRCKDKLNNKFLVMSADDILGAEALAEAVELDTCVLASESEHPERFGVIELADGGKVKTIIEKPANLPTRLVSTGVFVLPVEIFNYWPVSAKSGEYYLSDAVARFVEDHPMSVVIQDLWLPIGYPEDIEHAEKVLRKFVG